MNEHKLNAIEKKKIKEIATYLENSRYRPYKNRSGGFVQSSIVLLTHSQICIELKYGIKDGIEDVVFTERTYIDREKMKVIPY